MATKKVESKDVTPKSGVAELSFFGCQNLINEIELLAEKNDGVLIDEQMAALVEAHTQAPAKLDKLTNFLLLIKAQAEICKQRKKEINESQKHKEDIYDRLCGHLAVFVKAQGGKYHVGGKDLSTRKSSSVKLVEGYNDPMFCKSETVTIITPDKKVIKEALVGGETVDGAELIEKLNLSIK